MQKDLKIDIKNWLGLAYLLTNNRNKEGYTDFMNINPLKVLDKKIKLNLIQRIMRKDNHAEEAFLISFKAFCDSVYERAKEFSESKDSYVKDDLLSLDDIIALLDRGFDILLKIKKDIYKNKNVIKDVHSSYIQALQTILDKSLAIREYLSIDIGYS